MKASEYREAIRKIVNGAVNKTLPGLKRGKNELADLIAKNVHARLYGANVDGVASPIWRNDGDQLPNVDASQLLKDEI